MTRRWFPKHWGWLAAVIYCCLASHVRADDAAAEARRLWLVGKYDESAEAYGKVAEKDLVASALGLARCQSSVGQTKEATELLIKAVEAKPAAALLAELAQLAFDRGDYPAADRAIDAALKAEPENVLAHWLRAERRRVDGKLPEAEQDYHWLVDHYNNKDVEDPDALRVIGLGAAQFARWHRESEQFTFLVNELYPSILELDKSYWPAHYEAGLLFLEKFNEADASRELKAALELNPNAAEVHAALARLAMQNYDMDDAKRSVDRALEINSRLLSALLTKADLALSNFEARDAIAILEQAKALNPVSEETLGRLAAAYGVADGLPASEDLAKAMPAQPASRFDKLVAEVNGRNPHAGDFYYALASDLDLTRKYPAAARYYREAVERMPQLIAPRGALGLMYMRLGQEIDARKLLDEAFETDPFNVRVSNSRKVLEVLDDYAVLETKHFVIKFDRVRDEILARYAASYLEEEVYPALCKQFAYEPQDKSLFEIFSRARNTSGHGWFSARMVGLPYVGTVGACAGKMVALASPNDMPQKYNWARVLKHEFVHVLNLQQTNFNIPHWYTEALAVESEGYPRPQSWNEMLVERVPKRQMFNLDTINLGFVRPKTTLDWQMAYCQAQLYAQYMLATYGHDSLAKMLKAYADNLDTASALRRCFGVEKEKFEAGYLGYVKKLVAGLSAEAKSATTGSASAGLGELERQHKAKPDDPAATARLAQAYLNRRNYPEARKLAQEALQAQPKQPLASFVLARLRLVTGEEDEARELLEAALDRQEPDENVLQLLAGLKLKAEEYDEAARLYELGARRDPENLAWKKSLARVYLKSGDTKKLAPILAELANADADDLVMRKKLADLALKAHDDVAARKWATEALHIDVMDGDLHRMLAEASMARRDYPASVDEYEVAVKLEPKEPALRFALADACVQAKREARAREVLKQLLELSPEYPGAALLLESLEP
jgi:tetratricopeptide (TPR) repeat protein